MSSDHHSAFSEFPLFEQSGPALGNAYRQDPYLHGLLSRRFGQIPPEATAALERMGDLAAGELYQLQQKDRLNEPVLTQWDPWGRRIDRIEITALWQRAEILAATEGLVAIPYEQTYGALSRSLQFALVYLFTPSSDIYSCPLAMTDGAARTLVLSGNQSLIERALPRLTSRNPAHFWTSGQWMTELTGGSDVGLTETQAREGANGWLLYGRKWFTSAATSQMTLTLARPQGNGPGGKGLALFYLEPHDAQGQLQNIEILRLKDKLGTRKVPTAELLLHGVPAQLVSGRDQGVRNIAPMLNITRTWNSISALGLMRRGLNLAWDYARRRVAFGAALIDKPLHRETLLQLEAEFAGAFYLTFEMVHLLGQQEAGELGSEGQALLRLLTPVVKLTTAKQSVRVLSEVLECFGGAGYVEDTGLPQLLRDAQVLPIWEGTTNVLALEALRALGSAELRQGLLAHLLSWGQGQTDPVSRQARQQLEAGFAGLEPAQEAGARRFALQIGHALELLAIGRQLQAQARLETDLPLQLEDLQVRLADLFKS